MTVDEARAAAEAYLQANGGGAWIMRSCWNCNSAHERLKDADCPILCLMGCGHWYYKGIDITQGADEQEPAR